MGVEAAVFQVSIESKTMNLEGVTHTLTFLGYLVANKKAEIHRW